MMKLQPVIDILYMSGIPVSILEINFFMLCVYSALCYRTF